MQIEVSSHCNASCVYCPHTIYEKNWKNAFLPESAVYEILDQLKKTTYIHLQGWGEPFTHPRLPRMLGNIKKAGFKTGTTTNGSLLTTETMETLVDAGIDVLAFSIAGCGDLENDSIRKGVRLAEVTEKIRAIQEIKKRKNAVFPRIHIAQMLLRSSLPYIETYPEFWKETGADQIVLSSLSFVAAPELETESALADSLEEWKKRKAWLSRMVINSGLESRVNFHLASPFSLYENCSENIEKSFFINSSGDVFPCVMKGIPIEGDARHWVRGNAFKVENSSCGNIFNEPLKDIWRKKPYRKFRKTELKDKGQCANCLKRSIEKVTPQSCADLSSLKCRWELIHQANAEQEAVKRMALARFSSMNNGR